MERQATTQGEVDDSRMDSDLRVAEIRAILQQHHENMQAGKHTQMPPQANWSQRLPFDENWPHRVEAVLQRPATPMDRIHVQQSDNTHLDDNGIYTMTELIRMQEAGIHIADLFPIRMEYTDSTTSSAYVDDQQVQLRHIQAEQAGRPQTDEYHMMPERHQSRQASFEKN